MKRYLALGVVAVAMLAVPSTASAAEHFVGGTSCAISGNHTKTATIDCSGKVAGFGNEPVPLYVVIKARAGCSNPGNLDIPGQRRFVSGPFTPDSSGNVLFGNQDPTNQNKVRGTVSCNGQQTAFITTPVTLELWTCTSGSPTYSKKTGEQTNRSCTGPLDTSTPTLTGL